MYLNTTLVGGDGASAVSVRGLVPAELGEAGGRPDDWDDGEDGMRLLELDDFETDFDERDFDQELSRDKDGTEWQWMPGAALQDNSPSMTPAERASLPPASKADPADVTDLVVSDIQSDGVSKLCYWGGSWWYWSAGRYSEISTEQVRSMVTTQFKENWSRVRSRHITDVIEHLRAAVSLPQGISTPTWIKQGYDDWKPSDCLATRDSIVHLPSLVDAVEPSFIPATPALLTTVATEFSFEPEAAAPVEWFRFLEQLWGDDQQSIDTTSTGRSLWNACWRSPVRTS